MRYLKFLMSAAFALLAVSLFSLTGCGGAECADGTTLQDGECVLAEGLAQCEDDEVLMAGECVANDDLCGANAAFDDGQCIADDPVTCDGDTELDANTNTCVVTDAVCGDNTAFAADEDRCVPTADVCNAGTYYDDDSGLCFPESECKAGDVIVDGYCLSPAEAFAEDAEFVADGNTNPNLGGDPVDLDVKDVGEQTIFAGNIDAPSDVDDDGELDQDADYFRFSAEAGDWFEVSLMSNGLPDPVFVVMSEDAEEHYYERFSGEGTGNDKTRQIAVPETGDYLIAVLPGVMLSEFLVGADDWGYVGTLEQLESTDPQVHNFSAENLTGTLGGLGDNFISVDGLEAGSTLNIEWEMEPSNADQVIQVWESPTVLIDEIDGSDANIDVPESGEIYLIVDWSNRLGDTGLDYEIAAEELIDILAGETHTATFDADKHDGFEIDWERDGSGGSLEVEVLDSDGNLIAEGSPSQWGYVRYAGLEGGTYTVTFLNDSGDDYETVDLNIKVASPEEGETFTADEGDSVEIEHDGSTMMVGVINDDDDEFVTYDRFSSWGSIEFDAPADATYSANVYDFDDDIDVDDIEWTISVLSNIEVGTYTVDAADAGKVIAFSHDSSDRFDLDVYDDNTGELIYSGADIQDGDDGVPVANVTETTYSITTFAESGTTTPSLVATVIEPTEITDLTEVQSGMANERAAQEQSYYAVELSETTSYDVTLERFTGNGYGWARSFIYGEGHDQLHRDGSYLSGSSSHTYEFEFEADTRYVIRIGNDSTTTTTTWTFDYELSFDEVTN